MDRLFQEQNNNTRTDEVNKANPTDNAPKRESIPVDFAAINPLEALRKSVKSTVLQGAEEEKEGQSEKPSTLEAKPAPSATVPTANTSKPKKKTSSLLAKCMPYIYDDEGHNYAEEKPDYTLESVEDIIESAEKRANEKIARMYNLKPSEVKSIGTKPTAEPPAEEPKPVKLRLKETSIKKPLKIGEVGATANKFDTAQIPKVTSTLFDDFSARRTDKIAEENVTTTYSEQGGINSTPDAGSTRIIPELRAEEEIKTEYEDIISHTSPVNVTDISSSSGKKPITVKTFNEAAPPVEVEDFKGKKDIARVGGELKYNMVSFKLKAIVTFILTLLAATVHMPFMAGVYQNPVVPASISLISFFLTLIVNMGVFASFKGAFTSKVKIEFPLALSGTLMTVYILFSIICGSYPYEPVVIPMLSFLCYNYCSYKRAAAIFSNFKLVAMRKSKTALTLINDPGVNAAMARSVIQGEILTAGSTETDEIKNFLRHTLSDRPCGGKLNVFMVITLIITAVISLGVGVSYSSFTLALLTTAVVSSLAAAPSLFIADMLPFAGISERLKKVRAAVCGRYSAERIEEINALVVSSADVFPRGSVKLFNMSPLGANNLDETITYAAAVAKEMNSPLFHVFNKILEGAVLLPEADTVKYEDNLGISGWVGDHHIMIGNRSLMQSHGVRVPDLEVDKKILHKGFFPVYVACDQRACALLMVKYTVNEDLERELCRLADKGITLLIDNCDPNITEQMLCDYFGLYPDIVKILDHNGSEKYHNATAPKERVSAHGFHKGNALSFLSIISGSIRLRTLSNVLFVLHIICTVVICLLFAGMSLNGSLTLMSSAVCAMCQLVSLVVSMTAYYVGK